MASDLATEIRELIDGAAPVTADEAIARSGETPTVALAAAGSFPHRRTRLIASVAAALLTLAAVAGAVALRPTGRHGSPAAGRSIHPAVLTAARLRHVVATSTAAETSGTAAVTETTSENGVPQSDESVAVRFDGSNIDERITVYPEPAGSAKTFTTDDRLVGGQFYIYTPGRGDVLEWMHDTNSANDVASMQFPDPRSLYRTLDASAEFEVLGSTTLGGTTVTHLEALDPAAIPTAPLGNLVDGSLTSFSMWVDSNDVVQRVALTSSDTTRGCLFLPTPSGEKVLKGLVLGHRGDKVSLPALHAALRASGIEQRCGPQTTAQKGTVAFSNLGAPEQVVAPQGAVDFAGKG